MAPRKSAATPTVAPEETETVSTETTNTPDKPATEKPKRKYTPRDVAAENRAAEHRARAARLRQEATVQDKLAEVQDMVASSYKEAFGTTAPEGTTDGADPFAN